MIKPEIINGENYRKLIASGDLVVYRNDEELGMTVCVSTPYDELVKEVDEGIYYGDEPQPIPEPEPIPDVEPVEYVDDSQALAEITEVIDDDER